MEKLVRRRFRKDPVHLACRPGPIVATLLLSLVAISASAAQTVGHPAKAVRVHASQRVVTTPALRTVTVPDFAPGSADAPASSSDETRAPEAAAVARTREVTVTTGPYLPVTGALPLRFAAARSWPAPMPKGEPAAEPGLSELAVNTALRDDAPADAAVASAEARETEVAGDVARSTPDAEASPAKTMPQATELTAEMVLGYLGNLPAASGRAGVNFEPAIPPTLATSRDPLSP